MKKLLPYEEFKLSKGEWIGGYPLGYKVELLQKRTKHSQPGKVYVDDNDSRIVKDIFELYSTGKFSLKALADHINKKHTTSFNRGAIHRILNNKFYVGIMVWKGYDFRHDYPLFITHDLFDGAQKVMKFNNKYSLYADVYGTAQNVASKDVKHTTDKEKIIELCKNSISVEELSQKMNTPEDRLIDMLFDLELKGILEESFGRIWKTKQFTAC